VVSSALNVSIAQRLVRTLCETCKKKIPLESKNKEVIDKVLAQIPDSVYLDGIQRVHIWAAVGCPKCNSIGFRGRIGIYEAILIDDKIEKAVITNPSERDIREAAKGQKLLTLVQDGIIKVLSGITTLEELDRVVDLSSISSA